uniref:Alternative protein SCP2 n=1 Tax=Homo sapiens TaxID=9606 RepID=L0R5C7_HUMAN|nr:alternative protein SCP2 [Homo sapiens]
MDCLLTQLLLRCLGMLEKNIWKNMEQKLNTLQKLDGKIINIQLITRIPSSKMNTV